MKSWLIMVMVLFSSAVFADGRSSYALCASCHGSQGEGNVATNSPALAGQEIWYLEAQINNFRKGRRGKHGDDIYGRQMQPMAMTLANDAAVKAVATYIASFSKPPASTTIKGDAAAGKARYMLCASCHGPDGKGIKARHGPGLLVQQDWYLVRQLQNFKKGIRGSDSKDIYGQQMRPMAMTLPDEKAVADVVAYISSLAR
ncbi:MAG: c-type cytochrome [Pseudomonadales bacterium]|nr:c-type cytochrome [Pseudomonadales bacterium]